MKIKKLEKKKCGKYEITLENNIKIKTYDDVILNNNILYNKDLDYETINQINSESYYYDIYNKIVKMISNKLRSEQEIKAFLDKSDLSKKDKDKMLDALKQNGLVNDENFVKAYIHDKICFSNYGPLKIKGELEKLGVDIDIINKYVDDIDDSVFEEKQKNYVLKKINNNHKYSKTMLIQKIKNELYLMGYNNINIDSYMKDDSDILEKEISKEYKKLALKYSNEEIKNKIYRKFYQKGFSRENIMKCLENLDIIINCRNRK